MKKLVLLCLIVLSLSSCSAPYGAVSYHPAVNKGGHKAYRSGQQRLAGSFGGNFRGPNRFKKKHF